MNHDLARIIALARIAPKDYPPAVMDARAFEAAALELVEKLKATPPVDLESAATPKDIATVHAAAVAYDQAHEIATRHAATLARIAASRVETAWRNSLPALMVTMAATFDTAADALRTALAPYPTLAAATTAAAEHWNPETADLRAALATLNNLRQARDLMANSGGVQNALVSAPYELNSRTLWFDNVGIHTRFHSKAANRREDYYLIASFIDGIRIKWQTPAEQLEQPAAVAVAKHNATIAATIADRTAALAR